MFSIQDIVWDSRHTSTYKSCSLCGGDKGSRLVSILLIDTELDTRGGTISSRSFPICDSCLEVLISYIDVFNENPNVFYGIYALTTKLANYMTDGSCLLVPEKLLKRSVRLYVTADWSFDGEHIRVGLGMDSYIWVDYANMDWDLFIEIFSKILASRSPDEFHLHVRCSFFVQRNPNGREELSIDLYLSMHHNDYSVEPWFIWDKQGTRLDEFNSGSFTSLDFLTDVFALRDDGNNVFQNAEMLDKMNVVVTCETLFKFRVEFTRTEEGVNRTLSRIYHHAERGWYDFQ